MTNCHIKRSSFIEHTKVNFFQVVGRVLCSFVCPFVCCWLCLSTQHMGGSRMYVQDWEEWGGTKSYCYETKAIRFIIASSAVSLRCRKSHTTEFLPPMSPSHSEEESQLRTVFVFPWQISLRVSSRRNYENTSVCFQFNQLLILIDNFNISFIKDTICRNFSVYEIK